MLRAWLTTAAVCSFAFGFYFLVQTLRDLRHARPRWRSRLLWPLDSVPDFIIAWCLACEVAVALYAIVCLWT